MAQNPITMTKPWKKTGLLIQSSVVVGSGVLALLSLRNNNLTMLRLRQAVLDADTQNTDATQPLAELQAFVTSHMNTKLPRLGDQPAIQLKNKYDVLIKTEQDRVSAARQTQGQEATTYCEQTVVGGFLSVRAQCVADYTATRPITEQMIIPDLYRYNFASPAWSPDVAGLSLVVFVIAAGFLMLSVVARIIARLVIADHV
jgi:hypothetical protein